MGKLGETIFIEKLFDHKFLFGFRKKTLMLFSVLNETATIKPESFSADDGAYLPNAVGLLSSSSLNQK